MSDSSHASPGDQIAAARSPADKNSLTAEEGPVAGEDKSPGVARIEALSAVITRTDRVFIFLGVFLVAYVYGLDGTLRGTYQPYATASYSNHSLLATINVLRSVIAAAAQPTAAKVADVFGRLELVCVSVLFCVLGTVVEASATGIDSFAGGAVLYQVGYTMIVFLVEVVVADITSTRARLLFSYIPALPFIINTWVSGDISGAVLEATTWRWGVGMFCIIYPVCALPLILSLWVVSRRVERAGVLPAYKTSLKATSAGDFATDVFVKLDGVGIVLVTAIFALILVPMTIAGGSQDKWRTAHVIAPLVVGVVCIPAFVLWEVYGASHPLAPFALMKDRAVWGPMAMAVLLNFAWYIQGDYLYTVLIVVFDFSVKGATRVASLYLFVSVITGFLLGFAVFKVRRLEVFVVIGTMLFLVAFGLLVHYRGTPTSASRSGVIGAETSLQVGIKHEQLAAMTALCLAMYSIGSALGNTVSVAIWTQVLPGALEEKLAPVNATLAALTYADPFSVVAAYPIGTPERTAIVAAYQHAQQLLTITGICVCVPLIGFAFVLRNPRLDNRQNLAEGIPAEETVR